MTAYRQIMEKLEKQLGSRKAALKFVAQVARKHAASGGTVTEQSDGKETQTGEWETFLKSDQKTGSAGS